MAHFESSRCKETFQFAMLTLGRSAFSRPDGESVRLHAHLRLKRQPPKRNGPGLKQASPSPWPLCPGKHVPETNTHTPHSRVSQGHVRPPSAAEIPGCSILRLLMLGVKGANSASREHAQLQQPYFHYGFS